MGIFRWIAIPLLLIAFTIGIKWAQDAFGAHTREREWRQTMHRLKEQENAAQTEKDKREYVLEVLGLGITYEKYRQGKLWNVFQYSDPYTSIRERDPKKYEWADTDKIGDFGSRACDALENGAALSPCFGEFHPCMPAVQSKILYISLVILILWQG